MSDKPPSRFTPQNQTTSQRLSSNTVGLVALSDYRKRRAEVLEDQEREAQEASTPNRSQAATPTPNASDSGEASGAARPVKKKKNKNKKAAVASKLSFGGDDDDEEDEDAPGPATIRTPKSSAARTKANAGNTNTNDRRDDVAFVSDTKKHKIAANTSVGIIPKALKTKASMQREAAERERLRKEFLIMQEAVRATEIAMPFVFYDGADIPGGIVRVKKGDFVWVCLDKSRKIGADLGVSEKANARREWARVGVDDLMLVRGTMIIPHHYEIYFFIINKTSGPEARRLFDYSDDAPVAKLDAAAAAAAAADADSFPGARADLDPETGPESGDRDGGLTTAAALKAAAVKALPDISTLEGVGDDPTFTKVVDRRWYERHKHIYPASTWQEFDPEKDYQNEVRKDPGGNTFFCSR